MPCQELQNRLKLFQVQVDVLSQDLLAVHAADGGAAALDFDGGRLGG